MSSELGRGSVFRVFLPLATKPARTSPVPATPSPKPGAVLVVDDEPSVRQCLQALGLVDAS